MNNILSVVLIYIVIIAILFGPMIYNSKKKEKKIKNMLENLKVGDKIVTIGGIFAKISKIDETTVEAKIDNNAKITISKSAISYVINE